MTLQAGAVVEVEARHRVAGRAASTVLQQIVSAHRRDRACCVVGLQGRVCAPPLCCQAGQVAARGVAAVRWCAPCAARSAAGVCVPTRQRRRPDRRRAPATRPSRPGMGDSVQKVAQLRGSSRCSCCGHPFLIRKLPQRHPAQPGLAVADRCRTPPRGRPRSGRASASMPCRSAVRWLPAMSGSERDFDEDQAARRAAAGGRTRSSAGRAAGCRRRSSQPSIGVHGFVAG
jgi:hypothetical protein